MAKVKQQELDGAGNVVEKAAAPKKVKVPKEKTVSKKYFTWTGNDLPEGKKIPPQLAIIMGHIKAAPEGKVSLDDLVDACDKDEKFQTRQPISRVITFYIPHMTKELNVVSVETEKVPVPASEETSTETTEAVA
jgi:hypothetical protein